MTGPGHDPQADADPVLIEADRHGRPAERAPEHGSAAPDPQDPRDLERGHGDEFGDHAATDRQLVVRPVGGHGRCSASASAMRAGTRVRAVVAATSQANPTMRRFARPWVMMTVPFTPSSMDPPTFS